MKAIGMMSGTSIDGITVALVSTEPDGKDFKVEKYRTYPFSEKTRSLIIKTIAEGKAKEISFLNFYIGRLYAEYASKFIKEYGIDRSKVEVIGMHGQTIFHTDQKEKFGKFRISHSFQIGEPAFVAEKTGITVVSNFRAKDIAAGGSGAPLIPLFDFLVFAKKGKRIAVQNLGGIGNVTFLDGKSVSKVVAFDTGPCNMLLDGAVRILYVKNFDKDGKIARSGKTIKALFERLKKTPYLKKRPPKSAGRTEFGEVFLKKTVKGFESEQKANIIATLNKFVAFTICDSYNRFLKKPDYVILSGGGVFNKTLVSNIESCMNADVFLSDRFGIPAEAKEAGAFALYALRTIYKMSSNVRKATGAKRFVILGDITYAG